MSRANTRVLAAAMLGFGLTTTCLPAAHAATVEANDLVDAPDGTNVFLGYYEYQNANRYNSTIAGTFTKKTNSDQNTGIARYVYYNSIFGVHWAVQLVVPFADVTANEIGGEKLNDTFGAADPVLTGGFWLISNPAKKQYVAFVSYTSVPLGSYSRNQAVSVGTNRWSEDAELVWTQRIWKGLTFDLDGDYIFYGTNSDLSIPGASLKQKPSWEATAWLNYDISRTSFVAVGWTGMFGGTETVNGQYTGTKTEVQTIQAEAAYRPTPTVQFLAKVYHDINVVGGFEHEIGFELRAAKAF